MQLYVENHTKFKEKKLKNEQQKEKVVETEKKKETTPIECQEVPDPLVPSRKDKE